MDAFGEFETVGKPGSNLESKESWSRILRNLQRRGLKLGRLTVADGHLGIWSALAEQHPEGQEQRCWMHIVGRDPRLPEGWNVPSRVNPYEPGSLGSGAAEQSAVSKQTRHVSLRTQSGGTGKRSGRSIASLMAMKRILRRTSVSTIWII